MSAEKTQSKKSTKVQPLGNRIVVEAIDPEEVTASGIVIPDTAKEKEQRGKVIACGKGKMNEQGKQVPMEVKAGDEVLYGKYAGTEIKIDDKEYLIISEEDVLAIVK